MKKKEKEEEDEEERKKNNLDLEISGHELVTYQFCDPE